MQLRLLAPLFVVVFSVLVSACSCGQDVNVNCGRDSDCSSREVCRDSICVLRGASDAGGGSTSDGGLTEDGGVCLQACGAGCCGTGEKCESDVCRLVCTQAETRCGDPGAEACCSSAQLCYLGACITPGNSCTGNSECASNQYCDTSVGKCLPRGANSLCEFQPGDAGVQPTELWNSVITTDAYTQVMMSPIVIDVNSDGTPDVLANYFGPGGYNGDGLMRALNGANGNILWSSADVATDHVHPPASIAAGILRAGGPMQAVTVGRDGRLFSFNAATGTVLWRSHDNSGGAVLCNANWGGPAIADLNADGVAEIVCGMQAFDDQGLQLWTAGGAAGAVGPLTVVVELDGAAGPEITDGAKAVHSDGSPYWGPAGMGGLIAIGDFVDGAKAAARDGQAEIVSVNGGTIALINGQTGALIIAPSTLPSADANFQCFVGAPGVTGSGGPPTVADFDGDGKPEVGVANLACYTVFKYDNSTGTPRWTVLWSKYVQDRSSSVTGSSVFDFDGDGRAEVVYADEVALHVFDGRTGASIFNRPHCSGTTYEYPLVVDVNGNGRADIVISENTYAAGGLGCATGATAGIHVFKDGADNWVNTRSIWNQHTYHVTNICDGVDQVCGGPGAAGNVYGRIPPTERSNWSFNNKPSGSTAPPLNNFRQNVQGEGLFNAPDLAVKDFRENTTQCPNTMTLQARVLNQGALGVLAGIKVAFYEDVSPRRLLGVTQTTTKMLPGQSEVVSILWPVPAGQLLPINVIVRVDDDGTGLSASSECREDNNQAGPLSAACASIN